MTTYNIDVATLKQWMSNNDAQLVDVREQAEWDAGHIETATLVPLSTLTPQAMPAANAKKLVIYCRSGKRSLTACDIVQKDNPSRDLYNLEGGLLAWEASAHK